MSAPTATPIKYSHSKPATSQIAKTRPDGTTRISIAKKRVNRRIAANHKTTERLFGIRYPLFGRAHGVSYNRATGVIYRNSRAASVA